MKAQKMLTVNRHHLTKETLQKFNTKEWWMDIPSIEVYPKSVFGYFIYIRDAFKDNYFSDPTYHKACPADLRAILAYAVANGYDVVCFDSEEPPVIFLPLYHYDVDITIQTGPDTGKKCNIETVWFGGEVIKETMSLCDSK